MPGLVADATRIWELNLYWPLHAQCGVWDPKGKGVDVWECIRARKSFVLRSALRESYMLSPTEDHSTPGTQVCSSAAPCLFFVALTIRVLLLATK